MMTTKDVVVPNLPWLDKVTEVKFWDGNKRNYKKYQQELDEAWRQVNQSGQLVCGYGPYVEALEQQFAEFTGRKYAVMTGAGTHSLYLAYKVLGIGPGHEVIVPSNTFIATIDQIHALGATPILVDCDEQGLMDMSLVEKAITPKTKAIVPVHMEGKICNMEALERIIRGGRNYRKRDWEIYLIEDSAQALGGQIQNFDWIDKNNFYWASRGKSTSLSCYSLFPAKILGSCGNAGMITTDDKDLAEKLKLLRSNSNIGKNPDLNAEWGVNMEPDNLQAAILSVKMRYLKDWLKVRQTIAEQYLKAFQGLPLTLPSNQPGRVWQDFMIRTPNRDQLQAYLKDHGVEAIVPSPRIPNHKYQILEQFKCPNTDQYIAEKLALPCNADMLQTEIDYVIKQVRAFYV